MGLKIAEGPFLLCPLWCSNHVVNLFDEFHRDGGVHGSLAVHLKRIDPMVWMLAGWYVEYQNAQKSHQITPIE